MTLASATAGASPAASSTVSSGASPRLSPTPTVSDSPATGADTEPQTQGPGRDAQNRNQPDANWSSQSANRGQSAGQEPESTEHADDIPMVDAPSVLSKPSSPEPTDASPVPVPTEGTSPTVANTNAAQGAAEDRSAIDVDANADKTGNTSATAATATATTTTIATNGDPVSAPPNRPSSLPPVNPGSSWSGPVSRPNSAGPSTSASTGAIELPASQIPPQTLSQPQSSFGTNHQPSSAPLPSNGLVSSRPTSLSNPSLSYPSSQPPTSPVHPAQPLPSTQANLAQQWKLPYAAPPLTQPADLNQPRPGLHPREHIPSPPCATPAVPAMPAAKFNDECKVLGRLIHMASPQAVRSVVRDNWHKCLLGSDYHLAFIANATVHHASGEVINRALRDFGQKLIQDTKGAFAQHLTTEILDDIAPVVIQKASDRFLDRALQARLPTIPARSLLNALARSERLGYDADDIVADANENVFPPLDPATRPFAAHQNTAVANTTAPKTTSVNTTAANVGQPRPAQPYPSVSSHQSRPKPASTVPKPRLQNGHPSASASRPNYITLSRHKHTPPAPPHTPTPAGNSFKKPPPSSLPGSSKRRQCPLCMRSFDSQGPYGHHVRKLVCKKPIPRGGWHATCTRCGQGFVSNMGLHYHTVNKVCGEEKNSDLKFPSSPAAPHPAATPARTPAARPAERPDDTPPLIQSDIAGYAPPPPAAAPPAGRSSSQPSSFATPGGPGRSTPTTSSLGHGIKHRDVKIFDEISPAANASMHRELLFAKETYKTRADQARQTVPDRDELTRQLQSLRNCMNSRMSTIRRKYGVRIRERRDQDELDEERSWFEVSPGPSTGSHTPVGGGGGGGGYTSSFRTGDKRPGGGGSVAWAPPDKRPRLAGPGSGSGSGSTAAAPPTPLKTLSVSEMNGGLHGTSATAAVQDPTALTAAAAAAAAATSVPRGSVSSSTTMAAQSKTMPSRTGGGILYQPVEIDSSSDSESDIPAE
ncbi:hypothetical protein SODALDRAFT_331035 [Sodiomyces alkalinus F11]|uniref:Uncharacterized protein n=1 Tax=Sodiomyces alkalinus (strain CBS 110278 / VKM F-3762 / F11) TaxID=1314773 RepID=A0A3N2Q3J4_SODAK|nr:hypothetical protein SODALDRAFT_331035 [Sodiomyces alkalinus F11]ROT41312.1 hypothetical protein SODALDRAFT_331035 [Sodiomyces alkalinus F11]